MIPEKNKNIECVLQTELQALHGTFYILSNRAAAASALRFPYE